MTTPSPSPTTAPDPVRTARLLLTPIDVDGAARILAGHALTDEPWAPQYPFDDEYAILSFVAASGHEPDGWGPWQIREPDGPAVGGVGFHGPPDDAGAVEIGFGIVAGSRGQRYAAEAVTALCDWAFAHGARSVYGCTDPDNRASQHSMRRAGLTRIAERTGQLVFARAAAAPNGPDPAEVTSVPVDELDICPEALADGRGAQAETGPDPDGDGTPPDDASADELAEVIDARELFDAAEPEPTTSGVDDGPEERTDERTNDAEVVAIPLAVDEPSLPRAE